LMSRGGPLKCAVALMGSLVVGLLCPLTFAGEDPRIALRFLQGLRDHGFHDLAIQYLDQLRADPGLPKDLKDVLEYQEGRTQIDQASRTGDLVRRRDLLEQARGKLDGFVKTHPNHPLAREALVQVGRALFERGHLALLLAEDTADEAQKTAHQAEARSSFVRARDAFAHAVEELNRLYKRYAGFLPKGDPRIEQRDKLLVQLLEAMLQQGMAEYEVAETYPAGSAARTSHLDDALKQFDVLYKDYRTQMAGLTAQMWQAKCYEEQGKIGEAIGLYKSLLEQPAPQLRALRRMVGYFEIVAHAKRKEYALAADQAARWLEKYNHREERLSQEGMGVLLELAKNIDAQMPQITDRNDRQLATRRIIEAVSQVVRYTSPYKTEALALLKKYKPTVAVKPAELARLNFNDAMTQADEAVDSRDWEHAIALLRAAIGKADVRRDIDKINLARYKLSFCYYMNKQYYESHVLAEHLARRYPGAELAPKATEIGMQSLAEAYNTYGDFDRASDLERLIDLAKYTAATWPEREQGDDARLNLGQIDQGRGLYDEAIAEFSAVRDRSPRKIEAQTRLGAAHWAKSRVLDRRGDKSQATAEAQKAIDILTKTLQARKDAGAGPTDPGLLGNAADLAVAQTETGKPTAALALLEPIIKAQTIQKGVPFIRLMEANLLAQINAGQVVPAIASMKALEQAGTSTGRAQLYFKLGKLLEKELERLKETENATALKQMQDAYRSFLMALTESKAGQSYESLEWAGESLLTLGAGAEAEKVLKRVLDAAINNPEFLRQAGADVRILRTKLKIAATLRSQGPDDEKKFDEAVSLVDELLSRYKRYVEPRIEKGMLLEAQAEAGKGKWSEAIHHWEDLAQKLSRPPRSTAYFDAWYHAAYGLYKQKQTTKARQILGGVMRLNPALGSPEMKAKYRKLMERLK
ncbi:MAG: tetratricopeptide repeat protein, partial [Isosphaeraceae bacterium]